MITTGGGFSLIHLGSCTRAVASSAAAHAACFTSGKRRTRRPQSSPPSVSSPSYPLKANLKYFLIASLSTCSSANRACTSEAGLPPIGPRSPGAGSERGESARSSPFGPPIFFAANLTRWPHCARSHTGAASWHVAPLLLDLREPAAERAAIGSAPARATAGERRRKGGEVDEVDPRRCARAPAAASAGAPARRARRRAGCGSSPETHRRRPRPSSRRRRRASARARRASTTSAGRRRRRGARRRGGGGGGGGAWRRRRRRRGGGVEVVGEHAEGVQREQLGGAPGA